MAIRKYKPTSPGRRAGSVLDYKAMLTKFKPEKSLCTGQIRSSGRNHHGVITVGGRGGGNKRLPPRPAPASPGWRSRGRTARPDRHGSGGWWVAPALLVIRRLDHEPVDLGAVLAPHRDLLHRRETDRREPGVVLPAEPAKLAPLHRVDLVRLRGGARDHGRCVRRGRGSDR